MLLLTVWITTALALLTQGSIVTPPWTLNTADGSGTITAPAAMASQSVEPPSIDLGGGFSFSHERKRSAYLRLGEDTLLDAHVAYRMLDRKITVTTLYEKADGEPRLSTKEYRVPFYPTEASFLGTNKMVVAGKSDRTGHTLVQAWEVSAADTYPTPRVEPSGQAHWPGIDIEVVCRTTVYDSGTPDAPQIYMMWGNQGDDNEVFFYDFVSQEIRILDVSAGTVRALFVPTATVGGGPAVIPELGMADYRDRWAGDNITRGFMYCAMHSKAPEPVPSLFFWDTDRDGEIDEYGTVTSAEFGDADELSVLTSYWHVY